MAKPIAKEHGLQKTVVQLLKLDGVRGLIYYHIPNEGQRAARTGAFLKGLGMLPGAADLAIVLPGGRAAFLELKRGVKEETSDDQDAFRDLCAANGTPYAVARSYDEARTILWGWGALRGRMT